LSAAGEEILGGIRGGLGERTSLKEKRRRKAWKKRTASLRKNEQLTPLAARLSIRGRMCFDLAMNDQPAPATLTADGSLQ
jgi:hypothetical protein